MKKNYARLRIDRLEDRRMMAGDMDDPLDYSDIEDVQYEYRTVLQDTFSQPLLDTDAWQGTIDPTRQGSNFGVSNERLQLGGYGLVRTKNEVIATPETPVTVSGSLIVNGAYNMQRIHLRGNEVLAEGALKDGVMISLGTYNVIQLTERQNGESNVLAQANWAINSGAEYEFDIHDTGESVQITVTEVGTGRTITLSGDTNVQGQQQYVMFTGKYSTSLDNLHIQQGEVVEEEIVEEPVVEPDAVDEILSEDSAELLATDVSPSLDDIVVQQRVFDDFTSTKFDDTAWEPNESAHEEASALALNGNVRLVNYGMIVSKDVIGPVPNGVVRLSGNLTFEGDYSWQRIFLRGSQSGDGVFCTISNYDTISIVEVLNGERTTLVEMPFAMSSGQQYFFEVMDDGENIVCSVRGNTTATITAQSSLRSAEQHVALQGKGATRIDNVKIEDLSLPSVQANALLASVLQPKLHVAQINGTNVIARMQSPHGATRLTLTGGGLLSSAVVQHSGGTTGAYGTVTFRSDNVPGIYTLKMAEEDSGAILDAIAVSWDGQSLTVINQGDTWTADMYAELLSREELVPLATNSFSENLQREVQLEAIHVLAQQRMEQELQSQQRVLDFSFSNATVRQNFQGDMWSASGMMLDIPSAEEAFYDRNPQYRDENLQATIDAEWQASPGFTRAQIEATVISRRLDLLTRIHQGADAYNGTMQNMIFPAALQVMEGIQRGESEAQLISILDQVMGSLNAQSISELRMLSTFTVPTRGQILRAAQSAMNNCIDLIEYYKGEQTRQDAMAQRDLERSAEANWAAAIEDSQRLQWDGEDHHADIEQALANQARWVEDLAIIRAAQRADSAQQPSNRAYERAARLVTSAAGTILGKSAQVVIATPDQPNIQRERQQDADNYYIALTQQQHAALEERIALAIDEDMSEEEATNRVLSEMYAIVGEGIYEQADMGHGVQINPDTAAGQVFATTVHRFRSAQTPADRTNIAQWAESKTGIHWTKILEKVEYLGNVFNDDLMTIGLKNLFEQAQLGSAFDQSWNTDVVAATNKYIGKDNLSNDITTYHTFSSESQVSDTNVSVRFNVHLPYFHHAMYYLLDENGQQIGDALQPIGESGQDTKSGDLHAAFQLNEIASRLIDHGVYSAGPTGANGSTIVQAKFSIRVVVWASIEANSHVYAETPQAMVESGQQVTLDLSTAETVEQREYENTILTQVAGSFPIDLNNGTWKHNLGSPYHLGEKLYSIDINLATGGDRDRGEPVYAVDEGYIDLVQIESGVVQIRHTAIVNGIERTWYSKYLHMKVVNTGNVAQNGEVIFALKGKNGETMAELFKGQHVDAGQIIGGIDGIGASGNEEFSPHLHFEILSDTYAQIDGRNLLDTAAIAAVATDASGIERAVAWDPDILMNGQEGQWVNTEYNLIFSRGDQGSGFDNVWVANHSDPAQRKRLIWVDQLPDGRMVNAWLQAEDQSIMWVPHLESWESI